jgi:PAS domain S-box-containing protein
MHTSLRFKSGGDYDLQVLAKDGERVLCRGWRHGADGNRMGILAVLLASESPTPLDLDRLAREYELRDDLDSAWAVRPLELVREHDRTMLVLEDPGGEPLDRTLGAPMEAGSFLRLAIGIVTALGNVHDRGLVHKDIKPANIIVESSTGAVWLTGFGIASRLPRERQAPGPPEVIAGTFAYMAPEQSGRMNRSVDRRSDLYACGVVFYEMLTGVLPFTATDPIEWIHCHIARQPTPPIERAKGIPVQLSAIVIRLLAKTAEERYQTAEGVAADLRRCQAEWVAHGQITPFPLGMQDASDRLLIPEVPYGREREIDALLAAFRRVVTAGTTELVLVSGYSGIGKSSVVHELHKALVQPRALFASGKFDQYKRDIPYSTLAPAFQSLIRPLLGKTEADLAPWREALRETLGPNGRLIVNLIPELELVIGPQPPIPELPPQDGKNQFQMVFRRFLSVFAREEHPLALFLDDLQWLDAATLELLEHLVTHPEVQHLLLVGAYRDNEVGPAHPLLRTFEAIRGAGARVEEIVLTPLGVDDIGRLVTDALHCRPERAQPLAQLAHEKSGGNPFFAIQFIVALAEEGLLAFDPAARAWSWDADRIRARTGTDNVMDLMAEKLERLSAITQESLKQLACLGDGAEIATLTMVDGNTDEAMHAALWEAVRAGLVIRQGRTYNFVHDRVQQAAYALIPKELRAEAHLRIGRILLASMKADEFAEHIFDIANQFNRAAALLSDEDEKAEVAAINLRAGRKAKASAAHASACIYLAAGMALLDESDWNSRYELTFGLWLERAESVFLTGDFDTSEQHIEELLRRGRSKVDRAAAYHLKVQLHEVKGEYPQAVDSALACLRLFGIDLPTHPTWEQVEAEYEAVGQSLNGRPIESLIDLPLMTDPDLQAAMRLLSVLDAPACFTSLQFYCLLSCRMANISIQHGNSGTSAHGYSLLGQTIGPAFQRYREGYRFGKLACDLVDKHDFVAYQARVHHAMGIIAFWTQPIATAIDFNRTGLHAAIETGDMTFACYSLHQAVTNLLLRNDPLDAVWRESELGLDFALNAGYRAVADIIVSQQRFIAALQGRTVALSSFNDARFDEAAFEAQLTSYPIPTIQWRYWILKLKARYLSGEYTDALASADKAKALLWTTTVQLQLLDYFYYTALTVTALYQKASADEQHAWLELLATHQGKLREWAENYPPTFGGKYALVSAEIARIEGQDLDAMSLYEQAIRSAREHGFVQEDGLANELAARFYAERGFEKIALVYLRDARHRYLRWGAAGKVRQLEELHPHLTDETPAAPDPTSTIVASSEHLDLATIIKVSQAVSGEIVPEKLIGTLMRTAIEHAGAERGILILPRGAELRMEAEATTSGGTVSIYLREGPIADAVLPESIVRHVAGIRESVILDDASAQNPFSADKYLGQCRTRSILCLPLIKQTTLIGVLYLENNLTSHVFTPSRVAVLELLASQAAISLENTRLYADLEQREAKIRRLVDANIIGISIWDFDGRIIEANEAVLHILGRSRDDIVSGGLRWTDLTPTEWQDADERAVAELRATGSCKPYEKEYLRNDGSHVHVLVGSATLGEHRDQGVSFILDLTERKQAEENLRESQRRNREAQMELAHVNRITTMGQLTASIAHEVNQPIAAAVTSADAGLRWLAAQPPNLVEARDAFDRIIKAGSQAGGVIGRIRALIRKVPERKALLDINETILETIALTRSEMRRHRVLLQTELANGLPRIWGDRVQLQQVILNLIMNAVEAMSEVSGGSRELLISTDAEAGCVLVSLRDTGPGLSQVDLERVFHAFYTTKSSGLGMGLPICRSIIEAFGGRLWATANVPQGAIFQFTVPAHPQANTSPAHG